MKKRRINYKAYLFLLVLALLIIVLFFDNYTKDLSSFLVAFVWSFFICITQAFGQFYINGVVEKKYNWIEHTAKRAIYGAVGIVVYSVIAYVIVQLIMYWIVIGASPKDSFIWAIKSAYIAVFVSVAVAAVFLLIGFLKSWKTSAVDAERLKAEMLAYKYEALQNQINPHFLFNSFNVLSDLVYEDQKKAVEFISQLSHLFRYVLDSREKELVPIKEDLQFAEIYASLLQTRFEDKLMIDFNLSCLDGELLVPMTLQLLIENCVKHNEISKLKPLKVMLFRKGNSIIVENNLQPKNVGDDSKKTGLNNIKQQYSFFTNESIIIERTEQTFSVLIPIVKRS